MTLKKRADNIRRRIIDESWKNQTAHVGSCLSCVEILTVLFFKIMKPGDKFILSPGHKALALYATLVEKGILKDIDLKKLGGHPIRNPKLGIEVSTGSLGHGLSLGAGFALANPDNKVYVLLSDGDMDEGSTWEAIKFIEKREIGNVKIILDFNSFSAYQEIDDDCLWRIGEYGSNWSGGDGHDIDDLIGKITCSDFLVAYTTKGKGLPRFENKLESHYWRVENGDL